MEVPAAPAAVAAAVERMMRALGLGDRITPERLTATARRYADLMAVSREGHAAAEAVPVETLGKSANAAAAAAKLVVAADGGKKRKRTAVTATVTAKSEGTNTGVVVGCVEMERDLELATLCEHHLLPFHGAVHVAYVLPTGQVMGQGQGQVMGQVQSGDDDDDDDGGRPRRGPLPRSVLQEIVHRHGRRLQVQERLTRDIARDVAAATGAEAVMVAVRASHLCMIARGVEKPGSTTCTSACLGAFAGNSAMRRDFWNTLHDGGQPSTHHAAAPPLVPAAATAAAAAAAAAAR